MNKDAHYQEKLADEGELWAADSSNDETHSTVLISGALRFDLPTETPYGDKIRALLKFGLRAFPRKS